MIAGTTRVLITGGGTGIGRATAELLLRGGGQVAVVGRRREPLESLARAFPGRVVVLAADVADPAGRAGLVRRASDALGGLDGLVNAAGVARHQLPGHIDDAALAEQLAINLVAPLRLSEDALEVLEPGGSIVLVASTLALRPVITSAAYSAAKAGLLALVPVLAQAGARRAVRVNAVSPGVVDTAMIDRARAAKLVELHPLGRLGTPDDVASAIVHLLGAPWTTGTNLVIDGGLLTRE
jgi:NAD(P)-dependent dehydrogenase (short-subunit alcohol dehydrogenase family)